MTPPRPGVCLWRGRARVTAGESLASSNKLRLACGLRGNRGGGFALPLSDAPFHSPALCLMFALTTGPPGRQGQNIIIVSTAPGKRFGAEGRRLVFACVCGTITARRAGTYG